MRVVLKKDTRLVVKAGETVDVSPAQAAFLVAHGLAEAEKPKPKPKKTKE